MSKLKTGLSGLTPKNLVEKAEYVVSQMTGNTNFAKPTPALADITLAADALTLAIHEANTGLSVAKLARDKQAANLLAMMKELAIYVSLKGNGDGEILKSSGFDLQKEREPINHMGRPVDFMAVRGDYSGSAKLTWTPVHGAKSYVIEFTTTDPAQGETQWAVASVTTKTRNVLNDLVLREYYWYRVKAVGSKVQSPYSNVSLVLAA